MLNYFSMKQKGFTLIELLVVIAIIGLLSTLAIVALGTARLKSRDARRVADLKQIQTALELFASDNNGGYPASSTIQLGDANHVCLNQSGFNPAGCSSPYLATIPKDPKIGYYFYTGAGTDYSVSASLEGTVNNLTGPVSVSPNGGLSASYLIPDDAATVAHVYWNGSALVDIKGNAWTMNGTVPQGTYPRTRGAAGPFSASNYYSRSGAFFSGDFSVCVVYGGPLGANNLVVGEEDGTNGWWANARPSFGDALSFKVGGIQTNVITGQLPTPNRPNVVCVGRSGTTGYVKTNLGTISTGPSGAVGTAARTTIGFAAGQQTDGTIYEAWFSSTTPSDALFTSIEQRALGLLQ